MANTTYHSNESLWQMIVAKVKSAKHVDAAIAYLGDGGAKLLPLRKGDRLVVDMSPHTVRIGATDPYEIETLIRRGVSVFSRQNLHAKTLVTEKAVIAGSMNVSKNSQKFLDEAGIVSDEIAAVRRAREFIDRLCTEPVGPKYLKECKAIYKPPKFSAPHAAGKKQQSKVSHAKLWMVYLGESWVPEEVIDHLERGEAKAKKLIKDSTKWTTDSFWWPHKPRMADELELGDWVIPVTRYMDKRVLVGAPRRFLTLEHEVKKGPKPKHFWYFYLEVPIRAQSTPWKNFCKAAKEVLDPKLLASPRTRAIRDLEMADGALSMWTPAGRISKRKR